MKKVFSITLMLLAAGIIFSACSSAPAAVTTAQTTVAAEATTTAEKKPVNILDAYESGTYDGGKIVILTSNYINRSLYSQTAPDDSLNGDNVNDALWNRDRRLEAKFDAVINYSLADTDAAIAGTIEKAVLAGDKQFDFIIGGVGSSLLGAVKAGYLTDLNNSAFNFDGGWWNMKMTRNFFLNDIYYMLLGDFSPRNIYAANVIAFNKELLRDRNIAYPYDDIFSGTWTYDKFASLLTDTAVDVNNNGTISDDDNDFFGLYCDSTTCLSLYYGTDKTLIQTTGDRMETACVDEKAIAVIDRLRELYKMPDVNTDSYKKNTYRPNEAFKNGNSLFISLVLLDMTEFRDCEYEYGIATLPKLDEKQDDYCTLANTHALSGVAVPATVGEGDYVKLCSFIDAFTAVSNEAVMPDAYEKTLLTKVLRDDESVEVIEIANRTLILDAGYAYNIGGIKSQFVTSVQQDISFVTEYEKIASAIDASIAEYIQIFK